MTKTKKEIINGQLCIFCEEDKNWYPKYKSENDCNYELDEEQFIYYPMLITEEDNDNYVLSSYGREREKYLQENHPGLYTSMKIKFTLNSHLVEIDKKAIEMENKLVDEYKKSENLTEEDKKKDMFDYAARYKNIINRAREVVLDELIYTN